MSDEELAPDSPSSEPRRQLRGTRWRWLVAAAYLGMLIVALISYETSESIRLQRLATMHQLRAARFSQAAQVAEAAGRSEEADYLAQTARNHAWFANAYRGIFGPR